MIEESSDLPEYRDPPILGALFLICRSIWFNSQKPQDGFGVGGILSNIWLPEEGMFPIRLERVMAYIQLWGDSGEYFLRVRLVKCEHNEDNEEVEIQLGIDGETREYHMSATRPVQVDEFDHVSEFGFPFGPVIFAQPGMYEFQLWIDEVDEPVARYRVMVRE